MKTATATQEEISKRVGRFASLKPLQAGQDTSVPSEARDLIYSRTLLPVITLEDDGETPLATGAPIKGAAGMTMTWAVIPPVSGPALHSHNQTFETFTVVKGQVEFRCGECGDDRFILEPFDVFSLPPGISRAFMNVGKEDAIVQVLITGGKHDNERYNIFCRHHE